MKLVRAALGLVILLGAYLGIFSLAATRHHYPLVRPGAPSALRGAYHVHTDASDGRGTVSEVARAAQQSGLSFVVLTDHNLEALPAPRFERGVLLIPAVELSTPHGHLTALGLSVGLTAAERAADAVATVRDRGGTPILAHPVQRKNPWRDWTQAPRAAGLELYSGDTMWREVLQRPQALACALGAYFGDHRHGLSQLVRPQPEVDARLQQTWATEPPLALCALDAHGLPPYAHVFDAMATVLPAGLRLHADPLQASRQVLDAITSGAAHCAVTALGESTGFSIAPWPLDRRVRVGTRLTVRLPPTGDLPARLVAVGPGRVEPDGHTVLVTGPGVLRLEVQLQAPGCLLGNEWRPWLVPGPLLAVP
jgi:hypothetical protein